MKPMPLSGKRILITGAARRIGRILALACAKAGADILIHYGRSETLAAEVEREVTALGRRAWLLRADLGQAQEIERLVSEAAHIGKVDMLINNAAIFEPLSFHQTTLSDWERHLRINLTAPFLLSQAFAQQVPPEEEGRIINLLDWRALRPGADHFPYTISKAALAAMTRALAIALAPNIIVNGLALGAALPPSDGAPAAGILNSVPAARWVEKEEIEAALLFLLTGPTYITGEILHLDGGRHLV